MTITKRTVPTFEIKTDSRIQVREWNQIIETLPDEDGNDVIREIESIPHTGVIDPSQGDYDAKVKALGLKLTGQLAHSQESKIRETESKCKTAEAMCAKHCETITALEKEKATQQSKIVELESKIAEVQKVGEDVKSR